MWVSSEFVRAKAFGPVVDHLALSIGATSCRAITWILAAVQDTSFIVTAVFIFPAANNAISV